MYWAIDQQLVNFSKKSVTWVRTRFVVFAWTDPMNGSRCCRCGRRRGDRRGRETVSRPSRWRGWTLFQVGQNVWNMCSFGLKSAHHFPFVSQFLLGFLISKQTTASTTKFRFQFQKKFYRNSDTGENGQKIIRLRSISPDVEIWAKKSKSCKGTCDARSKTKGKLNQSFQEKCQSLCHVLKSIT